jgi:RNA polymerase sigma-70 factor (ECF subfamily)
VPIFENDRPLLDAFRRGDRGALTTVYHRFVDDVARLPRHGFVVETKGGLRIPGAHGSDEECEIVQEVFARAFSETGRSGYDGLRPYRPYLMRIAKNLLIDRVRRRQLLSLEMLAEIAPDDATAETGSPDPADDLSPEEALDWQRLLDAARQFIARLSEEERQLIVLRFEEGRSQEDVAAQLGVTRRRIRSLEGRVQRGLANYLKKNKIRFG